MVGLEKRVLFLASTVGFCHVVLHRINYLYQTHAKSQFADLTLSISEGSFATPLKIVIETDNGHYSNHDDRGVIHGQNNYLFTVVCKSTVANKRSPLQIQVGSVKINGQPSLTDPAKFNPVNTTRLF